MINTLDKIKREFTIYNMEALKFKSKELATICTYLEKSIDLLKKREIQRITKSTDSLLRTYLTITIESLDKFILKDMQRHVKLVEECGVDGDIIFTNYIFKDEFREIYEIGKNFDVAYRPKVYVLEEKYLTKVGIPY